MSDSDEETPEIAPEDGLSPETLAALLQFQQYGAFADDEDDAKVDGSTVCVAYTAKDQQVIAETYKRLQEKHGRCELEERTIQNLEAEASNDPVVVHQALIDKGVVRVNGVLHEDRCAALLQSINEQLLDPETLTNGGFGNVFSRKNRYDMYLRPTGLVLDALEQLLDGEAALGRLLDTLLEGQSGAFHELSSLTADPGAEAQPIHPDAEFTNECPLWTVFVALQDITEAMGPTVFLTATHTASAHTQFATAANELLQSAEYRRATLRAGDVAVFDARTLHFGSANTSSHRRTLFYLTIRNPRHLGSYPPEGSLYPDVLLRVVPDRDKRLQVTET